MEFNQKEKDLIIEALYLFKIKSEDCIKQYPLSDKSKDILSNTVEEIDKLLPKMKEYNYVN